MCASVQTVNYISRTTKRSCWRWMGGGSCGGRQCRHLCKHTKRAPQFDFDFSLLFLYFFNLRPCLCVRVFACMCEGFVCVEFSDACWHKIQPPTSPTPGSNNNNNGSNNNTVAAPPPLPPPHPARWCLGPQPLSLCTLLTIDSRSNEGDGVLLLLEC